MKNEVIEHLHFLEEKIFQTRTKWPHFQRLLDDICLLAENLSPSSNVVILERAYVYGGDSLFAPLFEKQKAISIDCQIPTTFARDGCQKSWTDDARFMRSPSLRRAPITQTGLSDGFAESVVVPNVVHHEKDQNGMFAEIARILKPGGIGYIFEALIRELHQIPDDFIRYTPWGFKSILEKHGLEMTNWKPTGGPFEAIAYCWVQALQYLPADERTEKEKWFYDQHFYELISMDKKYSQNNYRKFTSFPVAYSIYFRRVK